MSQETTITKLEQGRAKYAFDYVEEAAKKFENHDNQKKEYKSYVKKIPAMIKTNGLGATFAFIYSKAKKEGKGAVYLLIYEQTYGWLKEKGFITDNKEFIDSIIDLESSDYRAMTNEVMSLFLWLKRFADGKFKNN